MFDQRKKRKIVDNTCSCESHKMGAAKKYPVNASGVKDVLSGDMLASSRRNLVLCSF